MDQVEGTINDGAARCAVGWKASPSALRVCLELPWRGPGPFVVYHQCARLVQAGSHPPQLTAADTVDNLWIIPISSALEQVLDLTLESLDAPSH